MEADPDSLLYILHLFPILIADLGVLIALAFTTLLLMCSAVISGSEVAFFSIGPQEIQGLKEEESDHSDRLLKLLSEPKRLLATILICNNFINIAIVILSDYMLRHIIGGEALHPAAEKIKSILGQEQWSTDYIASGLNFLIAVLGTTFLLLLFGEILPKLYAKINNIQFAKKMMRPLGILNTITSPLSKIMLSWAGRLEARVDKSKNIQSSTSKEDLDKAIDLTVLESEASYHEADMLKSIIKFGDVTVKQIMKSRVDVVSLDINVDFEEVMKEAKSSGYSRIPIIEEDFDNVKGILYVKDLLGYTDAASDFDWQSLIRNNVLYVPELKKIDDLLKEFQKERTHMAIVVDEYGGSAGLVTLEDIMEEVIGEIKDEFDEDEEVEYIEIGENNFIFEGKTLLNDVGRIIGQDTSVFDDIRGEADSLAGLMLEILGHIPRVDEEINVDGFRFKVVSVSDKRIEKINLLAL